ncbi:unnamed protein product [Oppiella nova]|uniref:Acetylcholinesterase n=1 Tax=Oppiella nova TaxID=334625 RepID=A0A7R9LVB4_9ACAR|nr:unnamed protein product [Oppiella nova]CAG2167355.1 unnamed protein product [Oppiella nova]
MIDFKGKNLLVASNKVGAVQQKRAHFAMGCLTISDERTKAVTFTDPYYINSISFTAPVQDSHNKDTKNSVFRIKHPAQGYCVCDNIGEYVDYNEVNTTSGVVMGRVVHVFNQSIHQFLNIPYAEPPLGRLRFARPEPLKQPIQGIIDGTKLGNSCMQVVSPVPDYDVNLTISEDCLVLNIWTPNVGNNNSSQESPLKPVMFWIHGGGLAVGSIFQIPPYNGSILSTYDVVLVATNYRLGAFGYLYSDSDSTPGNVGFYDQLLALKWVRDNIHAFGGDKDQITIFGESAGSWSTSLINNIHAFGGDKDQITIFGESAGSWSTSVHILSPLSRGLFKRAIMESGAQLYYKERPILNATEALSQAKEMAKHFDCSEDQWLQCLRQLSAEDINNYPKISAFPIEGTEFLPVKAQTAFRDGFYNQDIDIIGGATRNEGSLLSYYIYPKLQTNITLEDFTDLVQQSDAFFRGIDVQNVTQIYLKNVNTSDSQALKWAFYDYFGDMFMKCPTYHFSKQFAKHNTNTSHNVYYYELTYQSKNAAHTGCMEETMGICHGSDVEFVFGSPILTYQSKNAAHTGCMEETMGICHGSDVEFVFGSPIVSRNTNTLLDMKFSLEIMQMWTQFAKTGVPSSDWPTFIDNANNTIRIKNLNPNTTTPVMYNPIEVCVCDENYVEVNTTSGLVRGQTILYHSPNPRLGTSVDPQVDHVIRHVIAGHNRTGRVDEAFYVVDVEDIIDKYQRLRKYLPRVQQHYAMKCNPSPIVLQVMVGLGMSFDCASRYCIIEVCVCDENYVEVNTTSGLVRGQTIRVLNTSVDQFLSIPFAEPPVGNLRFARPLPLKKPISYLRGTIDGTKMGNSCMQLPGPIPGVPITLSEDCLILNIWTPNVRDNSLSSQAPALKPVMFWIYGGGLATGSIFLYNGSLLSTHDVVIVAPNYRLGPFGFLYGGNDSAPGNLGFYDQLLALKWVRDNIHLFGGDKDH